MYKRYSQRRLRSVQACKIDNKNKTTFFLRICGLVTLAAPLGLLSVSRVYMGIRISIPALLMKVVFNLFNIMPFCASHSLSISAFYHRLNNLKKSQTSPPKLIFFLAGGGGCFLCWHGNIIQIHP